jgi:hypothetical protein
MINIFSYTCFYIYTELLETRAKNHKFADKMKRKVAVKMDHKLVKYEKEAAQQAYYCGHMSGVYFRYMFMCIDIDYIESDVTKRLLSRLIIGGICQVFDVHYV